MNWEDVVSDLDKRVSAQRSRVAHYQRGLQTAQDELNRLQRNLEAAVDLRDEYRRGQPSDGAHAAQENARENGFDWGSLTRNAAIRQVLRSSEKALMPKAIAAILKEHGRNKDTPNLISAALANMRQRGKVVRTSNGWTTSDIDVPGDPRKAALLAAVRAEGGSL